MSLFLTAAAIFAPEPYGIALNYATKQCAGYWSGDEFVTYALPDGWEAFEFQYSADYVSAETEIGTCQVAKDEVVGFAYEEACCLQLGYTFVSENIGIRTVTSANLTAESAMEQAFAPEEQRQTLVLISYILLLSIVILVAILVFLFLRQNKER